MAFFIFIGDTHFSSFRRTCTIALIALILICSFSHSTSSTLYSIETANAGLNNQFEEPVVNNEFYNVAEQRIDMKIRLLELLKSALTQLRREQRHYPVYPANENIRRYASQSFHAMRG